MPESNTSSKSAPIVVLFILSPVIAELLSASTPANHVISLAIESLYYGPGVLLIREFVRRKKLGWVSIILLGVAFGILEEGLLVRSLFNSHFMNLDISFGRMWGTNWVFAEMGIGDHAIYSVTIPILLTELLFFRQRDEPWLNKGGIAITTVLFALGSFIIYHIANRQYGFSTSWIHYAIAGIAIIGLIIVAMKAPVKISFKYFMKSPPAVVAGLTGFIGSFIWLILFSLVFRNDANLPAWLVEFSGAVIVLLLFYFISAWTNDSRRHIYRLYLASGAVYSLMSFGLMTLVLSNNLVNVICQIVFIIIMTALFIFIRNKLLKKKAWQAE